MAMAENLSQRRYEKYDHEGYTYCLDKPNTEGSLLFWRCDRRNSGCKGRIHTTTGADRTFVKMVTGHTCADTGESGFRAQKCRIIVKFNSTSPFSGNAARVGVQTAISAVRRRAVETMELPSVITAEVVEHLPRAVKGKLKGTVQGTVHKINI